MDHLVDSASSEKRRRGFQITCVEHQPGLVASPGGTLGVEPPSPRAGSPGTPSPTAPAERCRAPSPRFRLVRLDAAAAASTPSIRRGRWTCVEFVDAQWRDDATTSSSSLGCGADPATGSCRPPRSPRFRKVSVLEERGKGGGPPFPAPCQRAGPRAPDPGNPLANPGLGPHAGDPGGRAPTSPKPPGSSPSCAESPRASTPRAGDTCDSAAEVAPVRAAFVSPTLVLPSYHDSPPRPLLLMPPPPPARISLPALAAALPVSTSSTSSLLRPPPPCAETHSAPGSPVTPRAAPSERRVAGRGPCSTGRSRSGAPSRPPGEGLGRPCEERSTIEEPWTWTGEGRVTRVEQV
ncbi:unnamed protein product [Lampetra planeri]